MILEEIFKNSSDGHTAILNKEKIYRIDKVKINGPKAVMSVDFLDCKSAFPTGVNFHFDTGSIKLPNGVMLDSTSKKQGDGLNIWYGDRKRVNNIILEGVDSISLWNFWEDGYIRSRVMNAGMKLEVLGNERTYHCSDGYNDINFNKLIFKIKIEVI